MKMKKLSYRLGEISWIKIPNDWHKAKGIIAKRTETNMGLSDRDYSLRCDSGTEPLMVVEGFWMWWCKTHNQPELFCQRARLKIENDEYQERIEKVLGLLEPKKQGKSVKQK